MRQAGAVCGAAALLQMRLRLRQPYLAGDIARQSVPVEGARMRLSIPGMSRLIRWPADRRVLPMRILPRCYTGGRPEMAVRAEPGNGRALARGRNILGG